MRAAGQRVAGTAAAPVAAALVCFCALFFSGGFADAPLVWIGGAALALAAVAGAATLMGAGAGVRLDRPGALFVGCLFGLALWVAVTTVWSISPDRSWAYANRSLVYAAFALAGVLAGAAVRRSTLAWAAAGLLALVVGWALLAKCVPGLYPDYGRVARLRAPVGYWNELALLCDVAVPLALWVAAARGRRASVRAAGVVLLLAVVVTLLLTYSRFGVVLACLAAAGWLVLDRDRIESLVALALASGVGAAVFGVALALPGITKDGRSRSVRAHDGWIFALVVVAAAALVFVASLVLARAELRRPLAHEQRRRMERVAALVAVVVVAVGLATSIAFAGRIWGEFTNPVGSQITNGAGHLGSASSSNRWRWWSEAWDAFTRHPLGGTGAGTFELTDRAARRSPLVTTEPHNMPLQFLSETGIPGFLLYVGAAAAAIVAVVRARRREEGAERAAATALAVGLAAFLAHGVADIDWNHVATCGPLLLVAGALVGRRTVEPVAVRGRRPLVAAAAVLFAAGAVYSLAAPWLAERQLATATTVAQVKRAHAYDPLSTDVLTLWAALEEGNGNLRQAGQLYRDAVSLEPRNSETWWSLGTFYWDNGAPGLAYLAFSESWRLDRFGPAGTPCGLLDQARHEVTGKWPPSCRGGRRASSP